MNVKNPSIASGVEFVGAGVLIAIGALIEFVKSFMRLENSSLSSNRGFFFSFSPLSISQTSKSRMKHGDVEIDFPAGCYCCWLLLLLVVTDVNNDEQFLCDGDGDEGV